MKQMANSLSSSTQYDVIIVGGGLSGLQAAQTLRRMRPDWSVVVLEADTRLGGRVKSIEGLAPWPVEIGAEFLHGSDHSSIKRLADKMEWKQRELPYHIQTNSPPPAPNPHPFLLSSVVLVPMQKWFSDLEQVEWEGGDVSVADYLKEKGASEEEMDVAEALFANDFGCSLSSLGLMESIREAKDWVAGDSYFILDRHLAQVVEGMAKGTQVKLGCHVIAVDSTDPDWVRVSTSAGEEVEGKRVIVTVPLAILKRSDIRFVPPLPPSKQRAIDTLGMGNAVKVILCFSHAFWPTDLFDVVCSASFLPEIWATSYPPKTRTQNRQGTPEGGDNRFPAPLGAHVITGFAAGSHADLVAGLPMQTVVERSLAQLDEMFGGANGANGASALAESGGSGFCREQKEGEIGSEGGGEMKVERGKIEGFETGGGIGEERGEDGTDCNDCDDHFAIQGSKTGTSRCGRTMCGACFRRRSGVSIREDDRNFPAAHFFTGAYVHNWADEPFVGGAYSHPSVGALGAREVLGEAVGGRLFFGGEATHPGVNPCMQAALDTGERAAHQVMWSTFGAKL